MNKIIITFLGLLIGLAAGAQELSITSLEQKMEPMTVPMQKTDLNGEICAIVKVQIPLEGCVFEGNVIDSQFKVSEYWVYITPGSKFLKIKCPNYLPCMVNFVNQGVANIESKQIYELSLDLSAPNKEDLGIKDFTRDEAVVLFEKLRTYNVNMIRSYSQGLAALRVQDQPWGYINRAGEFVIPAKYDDVRDFNESGLAAVKRDGLWGFVDKNGKEVLPPRFVFVSDFDPNGLAIVRDKPGKNNTGYCGLIDTKGNLAAPCKYDKIHPLGKDKCYEVMEGAKYKMLDSKDKDGYQNGYIEKNGKIGFLDSQGRLVAEPTYGYISYKIGMEGDGLYPVYKDEKYGYINSRTGALVIPIQFDICTGFSEGYAAVGVKNGKNESFHFIDQTGQIVADFPSDWRPSYLTIDESNPPKLIGDLMPAYTYPLAHYGYINHKGEIVKETEAKPGNWVNGYAKIEYGHNDIGIINDRYELLYRTRGGAALDFCNDIDGYIAKGQLTGRKYFWVKSDGSVDAKSNEYMWQLGDVLVVPKYSGDRFNKGTFCYFIMPDGSTKFYNNQIYYALPFSEGISIMKGWGDNSEGIRVGVAGIMLPSGEILWDWPSD